MSTFTKRIFLTVEDDESAVSSTEMDVTYEYSKGTTVSINSASEQPNDDDVLSIVKIECDGKIYRGDVFTPLFDGLMACGWEHVENENRAA